ncbi:MAG: hypothetical protein ABSA31_01970 [Acidimicrobiales bacterium]
MLEPGTERVLPGEVEPFAAARQDYRVPGRFREVGEVAMGGWKVLGAVAVLALVAGLASCGGGAATPLATTTTLPVATTTLPVTTTTLPSRMTVTGAVTGTILHSALGCPPQAGATGTATLNGATVTIGVDTSGILSLSIPVKGVVWVFSTSGSAGVSLEDYMLIVSHVTLTGIAGNFAEGKTIIVNGSLPCPFG